MKYITDVPLVELKGRRVIVRAGLDVPLDDTGEVTDLFRVKQSVETIEYLTNAGARVIVLSHIGRDPHTTNEAVARALRKFVLARYIPDITGVAAQQAIAVMREGEVVLLENVRSDPREEENDESFARAIARLADIYVDDAFSVAHRAHASIVGIPKFLPSFAGILMRNEVETLTGALSPEGPSLAILGGAKFETKAPLVHKLLDAYDHFLIAGALANDVLKAQNLNVGQSLVSQMVPDESVLNHPHLLVPVDATVEGGDGQVRVISSNDVLDTDTLVDIGPDTVLMLAPLIHSAKSILWNGPTGIYEHGYTHYTNAIAELISASRAHTIIGGGDTVAAIQSSDIVLRNTIFLSTGGGAMLEFLMKGTLPGIEALNNN